MVELLAPSGLPARRQVALDQARTYAAGLTGGPNANYRPRPRSADFDTSRAMTSRTRSL